MEQSQVSDDRGRRFDGSNNGGDDHDRLIRSEERLKSMEGRLSGLEDRVGKAEDAVRQNTGWRSLTALLAAIGAAIGYAISQVANLFHGK